MPSSHWLIALPLALLLGALAVAAGISATRGRAGTLPRDSRLGVRSRAASLSAEAHRAANTVAWPIIAAASGVSAVSAVLLAAAPLATPTVWVIFVAALVGAVALLVTAGRIGDRAAMSVPKPATRPGGGSCGGCSCAGGGCAVLTRSSPAGTSAN